MGARRDRSWVHETRFGVWFQSADIWSQYVLGPAVEDLARLAGDRPMGPCFLDVGCGEGLALEMLRERFGAKHVTGVDIDPDLVNRARGVAERSPGRFEVREGNVEKLDLPDASVDTVFCHQTTHHVNETEAAAR